MGRLVDQSIPSLFNGVSRQPDVVRLQNQVQDADDALMSVVTGGFEKRPASVIVGGASLGLDTTKKWHIHYVDRDELEQYAVCIDEDGNIRVFLLTDGSEQTVNAYAQSLKDYIAATDPMHELAVVTIEDFTFIVNRTVATETEAFSTGTFQGNVATFANLPGSPSNGDIYKITGEATKFDDFFVVWNATDSLWEETSDPSLNNGINEEKMPHAIVRQSNGTWTVQTIAWEPRRVGDLNTVPDPQFIGNTINDIFTHKSRIGVLANDRVSLTRTSDLFDFFPRKATEQVDTDPIDRQATANKVVTLRWAVPFSKTLFLSGDNSQHELTSFTALSPTDASVDLTTSYRSSRKVRPVLLGSELYFASTLNNRSSVFEYFLDDDTLSNTAADITQHIDDYIPAEIVQMTSDAAEGTLFAYSSADASSVYVYRAFWDGDQKLQSAWAKWGLDCDTIFGIGMAQGKLYAITKRGTATFLERVSPSRDQAETGMVFSPLLNARVELTGTYSAGTDKTSWTLPYGHRDKTEIVLGSAFTGQVGKLLAGVEYDVDGVTVRATGDFSAGSAFLGLPYEMRTEFSKQFMKDETNVSIIEGRLQLRTMTLSYNDTVNFDVRVTPKARTSRTFKMSGKVLGDEQTKINEITLDEGEFRFPVKSNARTVRIEIVNSTPYPSVVTSASWIGYFNEISRQDASVT